MKCLHCSQEHPESYRFCPIKGLEIIHVSVTCPNCGATEVPREYKCCPYCGTAFEQVSENTSNRQSEVGVVRDFVEKSHCAEETLKPQGLPSVTMDDVEGEDGYHIIAKVNGYGGYRFVDSNGDICTPDNCERVENIYYNCGCDFSNFYRKQNDYFYVSSDGVKRLGNFREGIVLNETMLAVKGRTWQIINNEGEVIPLPYDVEQIYGMNRLGYVLCKGVFPGSFWSKSTSNFAFINISNGKIVRLGFNLPLLYEYENATNEIEGGRIAMSPHSSLVLIYNGYYVVDDTEFDNDELYSFDAELKKISQRRRDDMGWGYGVDAVKIVSDNIVIRSNDIVDFMNSKELLYCSGEVNHTIKDLLYDSYKENVFNLKTGNLINEAFEYAFDNFYVTSNNRQYYLYRKSDDDTIENAFEYLLPIKNDKGIFAFVKCDNRLLWLDLGDYKRKRKIVSSCLPLVLEEDDYFICFYNNSVMNITLLTKRGKFSYSVNNMGEVIAKSEDGTESSFAVEMNAIHRLTNGQTLDICDSKGNVLSTNQFPIKSEVAIPCQNGYYLLSSNSLYKYEKDVLTKIGSLSKGKFVRSICFTDMKKVYYNPSKGIVSQSCEVIISQNRLSSNDVHMFGKNDIIYEIQRTCGTICYGLEIIQ